MLTVKIPQFPQKLVIHFYENVINIPDIKSKLLSGADSHNFAFLNPDVILSKEQILSACYRALIDYNSGKIRTRNIHSEIIFCLGSTGNIVDSLTRFGIKEDGKRVIVIKVLEKDETIQYNLKDIIQGEEKDLDDSILKNGADFKQLQKSYKFQPSIANSSKESLSPHDWNLLTRKIIDSIQLRGC